MKLKKMLRRKKEGAVEGIVICLVLIVCLIMITLYSIQLRIAQNEKYETDEAVTIAASSAQLVDLYQYASTGENVLDCTGNGNSGGKYSQPYEATKEACRITFDRFQEHLAMSLNLSEDLTPSENTYIKKVEVHEFTIYNVMNAGVYTCTFNGSDFTETQYDPDFHTTKMIKGKERAIIQTSVYVDIEFTVEIFGKTYVIPITEYVYLKG